MNPAAIILIIVIALMVLGAVVYYLAYQRYLRRALKDPAAARHQSLPAPDNTVAVAAVILGAVAFWMINSSINDLSDDLTKAVSNGAMTVASNSGSTAINDGYEYLAYFSCYDETQGELEFSAVPKQANENTTITVYLDNSSVTLSKTSGAEYTGTLKVPVAEDYYPQVFLVCITTDGVTCSEMADRN